MKLVKPGWLEHRDENRQFEVLSVDASNDGMRLATGGLDSKVRVWSAPEVAAGQPDSAPGLLATLATHNGAVTCVRFSPDGRYLASGSDDRIVLVSERDATRQPRREFGATGVDATQREAWTPRKRLVGHDNDVQDLAWSPDGQLLASVGLDSAIIVWSGTTFEKLRRLDWHTSHIKGIAFDPANKFFATCSDDRTVRIVRYSRASPTELRFSVEAVVTEPFVNSPLTTYFRRCSWAPDGETVVFPNATNGPVPTAAVVDRGQWNTPRSQSQSLVGHEGPCEVARFSPRLYSSNNFALVVTAGQDGAVAIWSTLESRPVFVARRVFDKAVTDAAWSPDGKVVYACSLDGTVAALVFTNDELGGVQPASAVAEKLTKYGQAADLMDIPESAEQVSVAGAVGWHPGLEPTKSTDTAEPTDPPARPSVPSGSTSTGEDGSSAPSGTSLNDGATGKSQNQPVPTHTTAGSPKAPTEVASVTPTATAAAIADIPSEPPLRPRQRTTTTKDGRKRITPMSVQDGPTTQLQQPQPQLQTLAPTQTPQIQPQQLQFSQAPMEPSAAVPRGGIAALVVGTRRRPDSEYTEPRRIRENAEWARPALADPAAAIAAARLSVPRVLSHVAQTTEGGLIFEARNGRTGDPSRVSVSTGDGQSVFTDFVPESVTLLGGNADWFWCAAAEGGIVYVWTPQGSRRLPPLVLGASVAVLTSYGPYLAVVTATAMLHVWDLGGDPRALFAPVSLAPVLDSAAKLGDHGVSRAPQLTSVELTDAGRVVISLGSGAAFTYHPETLAWQRISEPFWAYASQFWDSTNMQTTEGGVVAAVERRTNEEALLKAGARGRQLQRQAVGRMLNDGFAGFEDRVSVAHLATRVQAAAELGSHGEYRHFLELYVRRLAERGLRGQLGELFQSLNTKPDLLREMLSVAAAFPAAQTLVVEYQSSL